VSGLGAPRLHLARTDSTNERAKALAREAPHGLVVTATEQTAGHGRQGRSWTTPPGEALLMSVVLHEWTGLLPLAAAVAVAHTADAGAQIKWPNDILIEGRKVAGILVEVRPQEGWAVLGIGVNVAVTAFPDDLRDVAGSLGRPASAIEPFLGELLAALDRWLAAPADEVLGAWRERDALRGQPVRWRDGEGTGGGIDEQGRLVVVLGDGERVVLEAGEVHLARTN
jgi:BirA family transcriptional regulator, biotin operon repressor / biotin---[acetyl-CoA-carboxylase] ligase